MKINMKRLGWAALAILGCKIAVNAQEPKMVTKPYKNTIVGIVEEYVNGGYILSLSLDTSPAICNQIFDSYEDSINLHTITYFLPLTEPKTQFLKNQLIKLASSFKNEKFAIKVSFEQFPIKGILVALTVDSEYTIQKYIDSNARKISFIIKK